MKPAKETPAQERETLRKFGITMFVCFSALGGLLLWRGKELYPYFLGVASVFLVLGLIVPVSLRYVYRGWMKFAEGLAWFNTRLILSVVYFAVLTPIGILMRLFAEDRFDMKWKKKKDSYWHAIDDSGEAAGDKRYERMF